MYLNLDIRNYYKYLNLAIAKIRYAGFYIESAASFLKET